MFLKIILACTILFYSSNASADINQAEAKKIENYLNSIKTLQADFTQVASNGDRIDGHISIKKPNKVYMIYNKPADIIIKGNGDYIVYYDNELEQVTNINYSDIPAVALLADAINIDGKTLKVADFYQDNDITKISLQYENSGDLGPFTFVFSNSPFELKQWKVLTAQNLEVSLSLYDTIIDENIDDNIFEFKKKKDKFKRK